MQPAQCINILPVKITFQRLQFFYIILDLRDLKNKVAVENNVDFGFTSA